MILNTYYLLIGLNISSRGLGTQGSFSIYVCIQKSESAVRLSENKVGNIFVEGGPGSRAQDSHGMQNVGKGNCTWGQVFICQVFPLYYRQVPGTSGGWAIY